MTRKAIVLGITADLGFAAGVLLASIRAHDPGGEATVILLHDGLDEAEQAALRAVWPGCRFQRFAAEAAVARVEGKAGPVATFLAAYSPLVLAKLGLPDFLEEFEQVVWLDADILVRGRLDAVWAFDCLAWRPLPAGAFKRREKALGVFAELDLDPTVPLLNGGVIGVSRGFLERGGSSELLWGFAERLAREASGSQIDELPWYLAAASRGMPVTALPMGLNHPVGARGVETATVVHAIGAHKFWNASPLEQLFPDWATHQRTWVAAGGRPYAGEVALEEVHPRDPHEVLRAAQARAHWLAVFRALRPVLPKGMTVDLQHDRKELRIFLHGRPDEDHLQLHRHANERRLGLEVALPKELQDRAVEAICGVKGARLEKAGLTSVPRDRIGEALAAVDAVLTNGP